MDGKFIFGGAALFLTAFGLGYFARNSQQDKRDKDDLKLEDDLRLKGAIDKLNAAKQETFLALSECGRDKYRFLRNEAMDVVSMAEEFEGKKLLPARILKIFKKNDSLDEHILSLKRAMVVLNDAKTADFERERGVFSALGAFGGSFLFEENGLSDAFQKLKNAAAFNLTLVFLRGEKIDLKKCEPAGNFFILGEEVPSDSESLAAFLERPGDSLPKLRTQSLSLGDLLDAADFFENKLSAITSAANDWRKAREGLGSILKRISIKILSGKGERSYNSYLRDPSAKDGLAVWLKITKILKAVIDDPIIDWKGALVESDEIKEVKKFLEAIKNLD
jgi:hypothetical protein